MTSNDLSAELKAMAQIEAALKELADDERTRVMQWAASRFRAAGKSAAGQGTGGGDAEVADPGTYASLAELYEAAAPETDADRALVAAYWYQFKENAADVEAQKVNTDLKHLGYRVGNITRAFEALKLLKPALVVQTRKEGTTRQARKKYRVTGEGKKAVERLIARPRE